MSIDAALAPHEVTRRDVVGLMGSVALALPSAAAAAQPARPLMKTPPVRQIDAGELSVGYIEYGPTDGKPVILVHGWPYDVHSFAETAQLLAAAGRRVIVPYVRGFGTTRFREKTALRNGQQAVLATDIVALMDALRLPKATVAGFDWGARSACIVAALWPERCNGLVSVSGYLIGNQATGKMPLAPRAELSWWYQFYFATDRGREGYARNTIAFNELIWRSASPRWSFDDATFARTAQAFVNPDHVEIVVHNYRWRLGLANGAPALEPMETKLAEGPVIEVPTITLEGDANGAPHPEPDAYRAKFTGQYQHRLVQGGIGHNLPQEAPGAFADAILTLTGS